MKLLRDARPSLRICSLFIILLGPALASTPKRHVSSSPHFLKHHVLPIPALGVGYGWEIPESLSPDGRWLAYVEVDAPKRDALVIYDLARHKFWRRMMGRRDPEGYGASLLVWRQDSQACAVGAAGGWAVMWPGRHRLRWISHSAPAGECCAAWSPRTHRLAMFEGFMSDGKYRVWDGHHLSASIEWAKAVKYPYGEERAWQCEWSPNEKSIFLRYYGHAERERDAAGHAAVVSPRTCGPQFSWGAEAGPAAWLDDSRLAYRDDDDGLGGPIALMVAKPRAHIENAWLPHIETWTLNTRKDTIWALTEQGELLSTPSRRRAWHLIANDFRHLKFAPVLTLSPRSDMIAVWNMIGGHNLSLISTDPADPWKQSWQNLQVNAKVLGWAKGQTLPLLEVRHGDEPIAQIWQLTR